MGKYSEQLVYSALTELQYWFSYSSGAFLEPGYPPLFYSRSKKHVISPNKSAIAGIGEGIAGLIMQRLYHCRKLSRPVQDYPDIVMEGNGKTYLVESKATTDSIQEVRRILDEELHRMAAYVSVCKELDTRPVVGVLVGTALINESQYHSCITEVEI